MHRVSLEAYIRNYLGRLSLGGRWRSGIDDSLGFYCRPFVLFGHFSHAHISFKKRKYWKEMTNVVHYQVSWKPRSRV